MPDGRVMRIDSDRQRVIIVRRGRSYEAPMSEVETAARVPSARVRFRLKRNNGTEAAEHVRLRAGTRTGKRQRRFGDLTGARRPGAKIKTGAQRDYGIDVTTQPFRVVRAWVTAVTSDDLDRAASLYLPGAVIHTVEGPVQGRRKIRGLLERSDWTRLAAEAAELRGSDTHVRVDAGTDDDEHTTWLVIESGQIAEQWMDVEPDEPLVEDAEKPEEPEVIVVRKGDMADAAVTYAGHKMDHLVGTYPGSVRVPRIKLTAAANPAVAKPAMAEVSLEFEGRPLRARASSFTLQEATDAAIARMRTAVEHQSDRERRKPIGITSGEGRWQHGNLPSPELPWFLRSREDREIVRHKSFAPDEMTVEEAAWDMRMLDYDFFLFVDSQTGADLLLDQDADGVLCLRGVPEPDLVTRPEGIEVDVTPPSSMAVSEALALLDATGRRYVFFTNSTTQRGNVAYLRYDGHYGLITPPASSD